MTKEIEKAAESSYIKGRYRSYMEAHVIGFSIGYSLAEKEIEHILAILEDHLKRQMRINIPLISEEAQEAAWQRYKNQNNL